MRDGRGLVVVVIALLAEGCSSPSQPTQQTAAYRLTIVSGEACRAGGTGGLIPQTMIFSLAAPVAMSGGVMEYRLMPDANWGLVSSIPGNPPEPDLVLDLGSDTGNISGGAHEGPTPANGGGTLLGFHGTLAFTSTSAPSGTMTGIITARIFFSSVAVSCAGSDHRWTLAPI